MALDESLQAILDKWGSEDHLYDFLHSEMESLSCVVFGKEVSLPDIQVKPNWLARGIMGEHPTAGGDYEPEDNEFPAQIGLFPSVLLDERMIQIVIAHELIHHWEYMVHNDCSELNYPAEIDEVIDRTLKTPKRTSRWRSGHSARFISKATVVARKLDLPLLDMLFRG
ncbi:hypothetical protein MYX76_16665 [Desulfobacterota bacterium AH_259_B03_O07]|nr:hypothetical protein [Desulfobacterota bacterium AH_259_B03_O07]